MIILKKLIRLECCIEEHENLGYKSFQEALANIEQTIKELQIEKNDYLYEDQLNDLHITNLNIERLNKIYGAEGKE